MCGIVGMVNKKKWGFTSPNLDMFEHLLYLDALRGDDSTGVFSVDNIGNVRIAKEAVTSSLYLPDPAWKNIRTNAAASGWAIIGHNRKATRGTVNDQNAHPFWVEDKLVLVHNGTVYGDHKKLADTEVDSHAIAKTIAEHDDPEEALKKINAAYALIWYNIQKKQLNIIRNKDRPLHWIDTPDALFIASEGEMLEYVAKRCGVKIESKHAWPFDPEHLDIWGLKDDKSMDVETRKLDCKYVYPEVPVVQPPNFGYAFSYGDDESEIEAATAAYWKRTMAAAYGCDDEPFDVVTRQEQVLQTRDAKVVELKPWKKEEPRYPVVPQPAGFTHYSYKQWSVLNEFYSSKKVKVECKGYHPDDAGPSRAWMSGQTLDDHKCFVLFSIPLEVFKAITHPEDDKRAVFYVEVDSVTWRRAEKDATTMRKMDDWEGNVTILGKNAKLLIDNNGTQVQ